MAEKPWEWNWSSVLAHIGNGESLINLNDLFEITDMSHDSWKQYIDCREDETNLDEIRRHTLTGRPLGETAFVENLEKEFGKRFVNPPRGRPRKREK